ALDVPERQVDRSERMRGVAGLAARHQGPVELVPDALVGERIVADDGRAGDAVDDLGDHVLFGDAGEAVADQSVVGLDLDVAGRERGLAIDADKLDVQWDVEGRRGDARDFHDASWPGI